MPRQKLSLEHRLSISRGLKRAYSEGWRDRVSWCTGLTKETDIRVKRRAESISKARKGKPLSHLNRCGLKLAWTKRPRDLFSSAEYREKMSLALRGKNKGKTRSLELRYRISATLKLRHTRPWNKGKVGVYSEETLTKIIASRQYQEFPLANTKPERTLSEYLEKEGLNFVGLNDEAMARWHKRREILGVQGNVLHSPLFCEKSSYRFVPTGWNGQ